MTAAASMAATTMEATSIAATTPLHHCVRCHCPIIVVRQSGGRSRNLPRGVPHVFGTRMSAVQLKVPSRRDAVPALQWQCRCHGGGSGLGGNRATRSKYRTAVAQQQCQQRHLGPGAERQQQQHEAGKENSSTHQMKKKSDDDAARVAAETRFAWLCIGS